MNYRQAVLLDDETSTTAATKTLDLKGLDPISRLTITKSGTNSSGTPTAHPAKMVTKIELVDGANILWSLSGLEAQAIAWYQQQRNANNILTYLNDNTVRALFQLNFGRWLWDEELAFDPSRFKNPQLKITHDGDAGGSAPDANTLSVHADLFDEKRVNPLGWLMAKEYNTYSLTSSAVQTIELPTDYPMRMLMVQSLSAGKAPNAQYNKLKLIENNGKKVIFDDYTRNLIKMHAYPLGMYQENIRARLATTDTTLYVAPTYEVAAAGSPCDASAGYVELTYGYGGTLAAQAATACDADILVHGYCPHGALGMFFGDAWDANNWFDVTKLAKLELKITAGSSVGSSSTLEVITEQDRKSVV